MTKFTSKLAIIGLTVVFVGGVVALPAVNAETGPSAASGKGSSNLELMKLKSIRPSSIRPSVDDFRASHKELTDERASLNRTDRDELAKMKIFLDKALKVLKLMNNTDADYIESLRKEVKAVKTIQGAKEVLVKIRAAFQNFYQPGIFTDMLKELTDKADNSVLKAQERRAKIAEKLEEMANNGEDITTLQDMLKEADLKLAEASQNLAELKVRITETAPEKIEKQKFYNNLMEVMKAVREAYMQFKKIAEHISND